MNAAQAAISHKQLSVPNHLGQDASVEITGELKTLLADGAAPALFVVDFR